MFCVTLNRNKHICIQTCDNRNIARGLYRKSSLSRWIKLGALGISPAATFLVTQMNIKVDLFAGLRSITLDFEII